MHHERYAEENAQHELHTNEVGEWWHCENNWDQGEDTAGGDDDAKGMLPATLPEGKQADEESAEDVPKHLHRGRHYVLAR